MNAKPLALACAVLGFAAQADVALRTVSEKDGKPWSATYIAGGNVRFDTFKDQGGYMLYRAGGTTLTTVMPARKEYIVLDQAEMAAAAKHLADTMKQMEQQLASMPPQVREMMKKHGAGAGGMPKPTFTYTRTGRTMSKGGHTCKVVDLTITGMPAMPGAPQAGSAGQEFCVVDPAALGIPAADLAALKAMGEFAGKLAKEFGQLTGATPDAADLGGWPVWSRDKATGESWVLQSVEKSVGGISFSVPAGYKQKQMPSMDGAGGKRGG